MEDQYKIPAFQRQQSLAAKSRQIEKIKNQKPKPTARKRKPAATRVRDTKTYTDINISQKLSTDEAFPDPLMDMDDVRTPKAMKEFKEMKICGMCEGYFENIDVAIIQVTSAIREGDTIIFEKDGGLFAQIVDSMQINRKAVSLARAGSDIGLKTLMKPVVGTPVYKVI